MQVSWSRTTQLWEELSAAQRRAGIATLAAVAGVVLIGALLGRGRSDAGIPTATVARGDVRIGLTESGELRAEQQTRVSATNDKQIIWLVPEGARVKSGDPLIRFESQKYEIAKGTAESALAVARADLSKALSDRESRQATEQRALLDYQSLPALEKKGLVTHNELEQARLGYQEVKAANRAFDAAVEAARANVGRAEQEVQQQDRKLQEGFVRAPRDGVVVYAQAGDAGNPRKVSVGMIPFEGMDLLYLPDTSSMIVDAEISEFDLAKVRVGSRVELRLEAYAEAVFRGEVTQVGSLARQKISKITGKPTGLKVFDVTVKVLDQDERLKPGLSTTVDILVSEHQGALFVPLAGIFVDDLDRTVVYRKNGRGVEERLVELAGSTDRIAIVSTGLEEGDEILLAPPPRL